MWNFIEGLWNFILCVWPFIQGIGKFYESTGTYMNYDDSIETLKRKYRDLCCLANDVKGKLANAESSFAKKPPTRVENWLADVGNLGNKVELLLHEAEGLTLVAIFSRLKCVKQAKDLTGEVEEELLKGGNFPQGLTVNTPHDGGLEMVTKPLVGQAFQENLEKIWGYLIEPEVVTIGVWGMGGVGKTTLVTHINNRARVDRDIFSNVFWVTVSQNLDIRKLQDEFAKTVNLSFNNEQEERKRAAVLSSELKKRRFLFILDDVWHHIDLDRVGIPVQVNGCKLIITTRSLDVCRRQACEKKIKIEPLCEEEAWELFKKTLGHGVALSPEVYDIALLVARECAGLPLGIIAVARYMREKKDVCEWRVALHELKNSKAGRLEKMDEVFQVLQFSYSRLNDPEVQQSFLYCALYPKDHKIEIEDLIQRLINERVIEGMKSRQEQFDIGHTILNKLVNSCLLEKVSVPFKSKTESIFLKECVKMHNFLRDTTIKMNPQFVVKVRKEICEGETISEGETSKLPQLRSIFLKAEKKICEGETNSVVETSKLLQTRSIVLKAGQSISSRPSKHSSSFQSISLDPEEWIESAKDLLESANNRLKSADPEEWFESAKDRLKSADPEEWIESAKDRLESAKDRLKSTDPAELFESAKYRLKSVKYRFRSAKYNLHLFFQDI